jgi:MFS transporter, Spinster family, sphingosine-1-phosphate transporter
VIVMLFVAQFFLWFYNGPIIAIIANCVPSTVRARAFALSILTIHLLGDAISPTIVGAASDRMGLQRAIQLVPIAMGVGALVWLYAWRRLPERAASNQRDEPFTGRPVVGEGTDDCTRGRVRSPS